MNITNVQKAREIKLREIPNEDFDTAINYENFERCLIEMADWKDKNPSVETIKKIIVYALTRTNIMLADDLENGVEWELLIEKALK